MNDIDNKVDIKQLDLRQGDALLFTMKSGVKSEAIHKFTELLASFFKNDPIRCIVVSEDAVKNVNVISTEEEKVLLNLIHESQSGS